MSISEATRWKVAYRDGFACWLCGGPVDMAWFFKPVIKSTAYPPQAATMDHVRVRSEGGPDTVENLRLAHRLCNVLRASAPVVPDTESSYLDFVASVAADRVAELAAFLAATPAFSAAPSRPGTSRSQGWPRTYTSFEDAHRAVAQSQSMGARRYRYRVRRSVHGWQVSRVQVAKAPRAAVPARPKTVHPVLRASDMPLASTDATVTDIESRRAGRPW